MPVPSLPEYLQPKQLLPGSQAWMAHQSAVRSLGTIAYHNLKTPMSLGWRGHMVGIGITSQIAFPNHDIRNYVETSRSLLPPIQQVAREPSHTLTTSFTGVSAPSVSKTPATTKQPKTFSRLQGMTLLGKYVTYGMKGLQHLATLNLLRKGFKRKKLSNWIG
jgi:hypothetical protein